MRTIEQVTDDEIVDAVASFGWKGVKIDGPPEDNPITTVLVRLGLVPDDASDSAYELAEDALAYRILAMPGRLEDSGDGHIVLTGDEWVRRICGSAATGSTAVAGGEG
jgi:hypothetical protein